MEQLPLVDQKVLLERFPGKGGWTYARLPLISEVKRNHFGWQKVRGFIDEYEIKTFHIMPMGKGQFMIAVKAEIRKAINKKEGDWVHVKLFSFEAPLPLPEDFQLCLEDEPQALKNFLKLPEKDRKECLDWIYAIKSEPIIVERMAAAINNLAQGLPVPVK